MSGRALATADENVPVFIGVVHKVVGQVEQVCYEWKSTSNS